MNSKETAPLNYLDQDINQYVKREMQNSLVMSTGFDASANDRLSYQKAALLATAKQQQSTWRSQENLLSYKKPAEKKLKPVNREENNQHKYTKIQEKIGVKLPSNYYKDLPIKPGLYFFDCLLKVPRIDYRKLKVRIPNMLYYTDKLYYVYNSEDGRLSCTTEINGFRFNKYVEEFRAKPLPNDEIPPISHRVAVVFRRRGDHEGNLEKILLDWNGFKTKMSGNEYIQSSMLQRYIRSPGGRPAVTRLHYQGYQKGNKANYAFFLTSRLKAEEMASIQQCVVDNTNPQTVDIFTKSGVALRPFEQEAEKIVKFLNIGYNIRIEEIVLDFMSDDKGCIWLIGCKEIKVDQNSASLATPMIKDWWPDLKHADYIKSPTDKDKQKERQEEKKKNLMSFVHCKLCRLYYQNNELAHLVSVRMLMLYKVHVNRRMDLTWDTSHLKITSNTMLSQSVRVCQYCYMLVTSEFELMKVEKQIGEILSIPQMDLGYEEDPGLIVQLQFLPKQLIQWRVLIQGSKIFDFEPLPKTFFLHYNFAGHITTFEIKSSPLTTEFEPYLPINISRMHYLFSSPEKSIKNFLNVFVFEMRITEGDKFEERVIATTKGKVLNELPSTLPMGVALTQKKQMLFFNADNETMCNMSVHIGLSCDKFFPSKKIKVLMSKQKETYIPESHFMTTDPLPLEWMELFGVEALNETTFGPQIDEEKFYCPQMSRLEMMRMEDITSPYRKLHSASYDHITSKVLRPATARLPETKPEKEIRIRKKQMKIETNDKLEEVPEEVAPFYRVVSDYLKSRPLTAATKKKSKMNDSKRSMNTNGIESLSTLVSPRVGQTAFDPYQKL